MRIGAIVAERYEILRFLGRGGMGEVYEARDKELGDLVALKTLAMTALDDSKAVTRLKGEVLLARRVAHPNVCRIFDFGVHESRRADQDTERLPFLTMELLSGQTLGQRLRQKGPMRTMEARTVVEQIVAGLAEVHRVGIIHRDLTSENVFLAKSEVGERVVLMDFGLARKQPPVDLASVSLTHGLVGTVAYMSPEQIENKPLGPQSDIYALGVVMYQMMTGILPFTGATAFDIALERLRRLPASPSTVNPNVPRAWVRTIMKCLAIDPSERFQGATDVLVSLDNAHHCRSSRGWVVFGASIAALVIGIAAAWPHRPLPQGTKDLSAMKDVGLVPPAILPQPTVRPQPSIGTDNGQAADRPVANHSENEAVQPRSKPPMPASPYRHISDRNKSARVGATRRAAFVPPVLQAAEQTTGGSFTTPVTAPSASSQRAIDNAPSALDPADRIFNPFAHRDSTP